ncbi:putative transcription factor Hap3/NF-YB family [Medicago truncatula]|uniref:Putative transcription factor Hap3/NF-YB family n=1 Tax=Medicago truncatula TaxID=3880 RepID=G7J040_MEDTR|nr:transcription initiation factor TFIID subunit 6 [Medicago truncatula]AES70437.1 TATA-binding protein associated factor [Medicago truncatula]RHN67210.1 putative transcription factor Hap3/NF-YB family [Medicago truncatula]
MSVIPKESIEVIAQTLGINNLSSDVALALSPDLEYRIREIMQESIKCMRHSMRTFLTTDDFDTALALRNLEPIYGFASNDPPRFKKAAGHNDLFYIDDKDVDIKDLVEADLPKAPLDTSITSHWLAIEGVQPAIPENAPPEASTEIKNSEYKEDRLPVDIKLPVKHVITTELQLYYEKIIELILNKSGSILFRRALVTLATDSGLHPLVPYFTRFVADEVARNLNNLNILFALMRLVRSLLQNPHIHIELYLHQLMPPIITCIVAKRIGNRLSDNHWELRDFSANLVALICKRFGHMYHNLQPRVTKTFLHTFLDPTKALPQHYGAIKGIAALGSRLVRLLILPNLEPYLHLLEPEKQLEKQKNEIKRQEAWQVYGALLCAVGQNMHEKVKRFSSLLSPQSRATSSGNGKAMIAMPGVSGVVAPMNSMSVDNMQGSTSGFPTMMGVSNSSVGMSSSMGRQLSNENNTSSSILAQAWKDDIDAGQLLPPVFELFGESLLSFIPKPQAFIFL